MILLITVLTSQAQTKYYKAVSFNSKAKNCDWSGWVNSNVEVSINFTTRHIEIDSTDPQIIDFTGLTETNTTTYKMYSASGTDKYYNLIGVLFQLNKNGLFYLTIQYDDGSYSYNLVETNLY